MAPSKFLLGYWPYLISAFLALVCIFVVRLIKHRLQFKDLSIYLGGSAQAAAHFTIWKSAILRQDRETFPERYHLQIIFTEIAREQGLRGLYYLDTYPVGKPLLFVIDPTVAAQVHTAARHPLSRVFLRGLTGTKSIFAAEGKEWQAQRSWFAPAFSMTHLTTLVPGMVEETLIFREKLTKYAVNGEIFPMLELAIRLTVDVISRSGFDLKLNSQTEDGPIYKAFQNAISWPAGLVSNVFHKLLSPYMMDYYTGKLDKILGPYIKERYADNLDDKTSKSILDLALRGYRKENGKLGKSVTEVDDEFLRIAVDNFKTFFVGGHDTTASLVTYTFYLLSTHLEVLERVRKEHDEVFGKGFEATMQSLKDEPHLLNQLPITLAVFKETLRLFPVGFIVKKGAPGSTLAFEGITYPTDGYLSITPLSHSLTLFSFKATNNLPSE